MTDAIEAGEPRRQAGVPFVDREYQTPWQDVMADGKSHRSLNIAVFRYPGVKRRHGIPDINAEHKSADSRSYPIPDDVHSYHARWQFEHRRQGKEQYRCGCHLGVSRKLVYLMAFMEKGYSS